MAERIPAYEGRDPFLFVSYAHLNSEKVLPVIQALFADKYRVWYDEGIAPGSEWPKNIEDHLKVASAVVVFVSEDSLRSPNCENEVANAAVGTRPVFQFALGTERHDLLSPCPTVSDYEALRALLDDTLIGDGVTGYDRGVGTAGRGNFWTGIIAVAVGLIIALGVSIYGLNTGWFDSMLPGRASGQEVEQAQQEVLQLESNVITHGIVEQTDANLAQEIPFASEEARDILYRAIGFDEWGQDTPLTYENLSTCYVEELWLEKPNDEVLCYLQYFPGLCRVWISGGDVTTLAPLMTCAHLETVYLRYDVFPVEIPENAPFTVEFMN